MSAEQNILVSVCFVTYNHEKFVAQALESAINQVVNFGYEIVVGEDCSTDGTRAIVEQYACQYPDLIVNLPRPNNLGARLNGIDIRRNCRGKYIAMLEGDDYWTDPHKLQKQVDFLEAHPDYTLCFHNVVQVYEDNSQTSHNFCPADQKEVLVLEDLLERHHTPTCSVMFCRKVISELPNWFFDTMSGDSALNILCAQHGKLGYINQVMGVHRKHAGGVWSGMNAINQQKNSIKFYQTLVNNLPAQYKPVLDFSLQRRCRYLAYQLVQEILSHSADGWHTARHVEQSLQQILEYTAVESRIAQEFKRYFYTRLLFQGYKQRQYQWVPYAWRRAVWHEPKLLSNLGAWSIRARVIWSNGMEQIS